jgi:hypothetical protein
MARKIGFVNYEGDEDKISKKEKKQDPASYIEVMDAYFKDSDDSGRWTSQEIHENLMETLRIPIIFINEYMRTHGYHLVREDDRLVWTK